jgi:hypothetical protein
MSPYELSSPDWSIVLGGSDEAGWLADRDRKLGLILGLSDDVIETAQILGRQDALFTPSVDILTGLPFAVDWYISLAGFALKTLQNIREAPSAFGLNVRPVTLRANLTTGRPVSRGQLAAFAAWLTDEIDKTWAPEQRSPSRALVVVSAILGGRAIGQGQNAGGSEAVLLLNSNISAYAERSDLTLEIFKDDRWVSARGASASVSARLRVDGRLMIFFPVGGNVPDVRFESLSTSRLLGVGEIKGRKDLSNVWESWMPQVVDHMLTWTGEFPEALRLFFGTLITEEMVIGQSAKGTERRGLRGLHEEGHLNGVYNLSKLTLDDGPAWESFNELMGYLLGRC